MKMDSKYLAQLRWQANNPAKVAVISRRRRSKRLAIVDGAKDHPCMDCGVKYLPRIMQFDHARGEKTANISAMIMRNVSISEILEEIAKCDVVCANCHATRTHYAADAPQGEIDAY